MPKECTHSLVEQDTACADGMCPLCLAKDLIRGNGKCVKIRRKLEARIKELQIYANDGTYLKRLARQITNVLEENRQLKEKKRLLILDMQEALEACIGDDIEQATKLLEQALTGYR